jgi:hypothetical protein
MLTTTEGTMSHSYEFASWIGLHLKQIAHKLKSPITPAIDLTVRTNVIFATALVVQLLKI